MGGICMNSMDNTVVVNNNEFQKKKHSNESSENYEQFIFYKKIQTDNILNIIDTKEAFELFNKIEYNYSTIKEKWKITIFSNRSKKKATQRNSIIPYTDTLFKLDCNYKIKNNFNENLVILFLQYIKQDKLSFINLLSNCPPNEFRWLTWLSICIHHYEFKFISEEEYHKLVDLPIEREVEIQIKKDLCRSAPNVLFFQKEENRRILFNILKAVAVEDSELSYCQGMNILTAHLVLVSDGNEVETFNIIRYIFSIYCNIKLREFYLNGFPRLNMYIFLLKEILREKLPLIYDKILDLNVPDELWLFKWLQSLFAIVLPFCVVIRLWDCIFAFGIEFILNYSIIYICYNKEKILLSKDIGDFLDSFNNSFKSEKEMFKFREKIIHDAKKFMISDTLIMKLKLKFEKAEVDKFNFNKFEKNKSLGLSSSGFTDLKSTIPLNFEGKNELEKIGENLKYISEANECDKDYINDINQINIEIDKKLDLNCNFEQNNKIHFK